MKIAMPDKQQNQESLETEKAHWARLFNVALHETEGLEKAVMVRANELLARLKDYDDPRELSESDKISFMNTFVSHRALTYFAHQEDSGLSEESRELMELMEACLNSIFIDLTGYQPLPADRIVPPLH